MKIVIVTDAWEPQVNGVVRAIAATTAILRQRGHLVELVTPTSFRTMACPTYPEVRLALRCTKPVAEILDAFDPDAIHIATEGPLGWAARRWCLNFGVPFTTSFHTRFPDYIAMRTGLPAGLFWRTIRRFHEPAARTMAATGALCSELKGRGFAPLHRWPLGVDLAQFHPDVKPDARIAVLPRPLMLNVGRIAVEKNIEAFLRAPVEGTKIVVGDGPARATLQRRYPHVLFLGTRQGVSLSATFAAADVFVFPSRTDTLGLVNLEALASGVPVAAFPVRGPLDILGFTGTGTHDGNRLIGATDDDLAVAIRTALRADREACVNEAEHYGWQACTDAFLSGLAIAKQRKSRAA